MSKITEIISRLFLIFFLIQPLALHASLMKDPTQPALVANSSITASDVLPSHVIKRTKQSVVMISNRSFKAAYQHPGVSWGTGFLVDKELGIIVTNSHLSDRNELSQIDLSFSNGIELRAQLIYSDPIHDFTFLKVDAQKIPEDAQAIHMEAQLPSLEQKVFICGNNERHNFSIQTGIVSNKYDSVGIFAQHSLIVSLNARGGASGSPLLDLNGNALGIVFAASETTASVLPSAYLIDALEHLRQKKTPVRKDTGAMLGYQSLSQMAKYALFPQNEVEAYVELYPEAHNRAICVTDVSEGSPADGILEPGDVVWSINGEKLGPDLYAMQRLMNHSALDSICIEVYRNGELKEFTVDLYDLNAKRINRMLLFGGAVFYESDDYIRRISGAALGSVCVSRVEHNSSFFVFPSGRFEDFGDFALVHITRLANKQIRSLDDVIQIIPELIEKENFTVNFRNQTLLMRYNNTPSFSKRELQVGVSYSPYEAPPRLLIYNTETRQWEDQELAN